MKKNKPKLTRLAKRLIPQYMWKYIIFFQYLNIVDALMTTLMLMYLPLTELNPLMAKLINIDYMSFIVAKVGLGLLSTLFGIKNRSYNLMRFSFFLYLTVVTWNIIVLAIHLHYAR